MENVSAGLWTRRGFLHAMALIPYSYSLLGQVSQAGRNPRFLTYNDVAVVLESGSGLLPAEMVAASVADRRRLWPRWIENHDKQIRERLIRGEEDTLVNFVLFGVSFTRQPRLDREISEFDPDNPVIAGRIQDFVSAVTNPGSDGRRLILRDLLRTLGHGTATLDQRDRLASYVEQSMRRYLAERAGYDQAVRRALANDTTSSFAATAHLYRDRGLSLDTDFRPNYGVELALAEARRRGLLKSVRRVAIVGPGLDFTDKDAGFDHYPLQSLQPLALVDSLMGLGLAELRTLEVTLFDISVPVLQHFTAASERAGSGEAYTLQLILDPAPDWNAQALAYWRRLGSRIGAPAAPLPAPPGSANLTQRAIRVVPEVMRVLQPVSLNVVTQTRDSDSQKFDLIVGTNIFIYYDPRDQALALLNMQRMLASGGVLVTNDLLQGAPGLRLQSVASFQVDFSRTQADQMQIYSASAFRPQLPPQ